MFDTCTHAHAHTHGREADFPWFSNPAMFAAVIMMSGKEHDNLFRRVCLPGASNYSRMRGARAGFVLKVNILYIEPQPGHERFLLSAKWTSAYMSSDEVGSQKAGWGALMLKKHQCPPRGWWIHPPTHSQADWVSAWLFTFLFVCFSKGEEERSHFYLPVLSLFFLPPFDVTYTEAN